MLDLAAALGAWFGEALKAYSLTMWKTVAFWAGGAEGPLWRWALVEQGLFLLLLIVGSWWIRMVIGVGRLRQTPQHWGAAAVFACGFSLLWNWYSFVASQAIVQGLHPQYGWEWTFFTWGLPLLVASALLPAASLLMQLGVALAIGVVVLLLLGRSWAAAPGRGLR